MLRDRIKELFSVFDRGHASFAGSSALVLLFPVLSAPVVARLYSPSDFGTYAVFYALATILSAISSLSLQNAILLETTSSGHAQASLLAICLTALFSAVLLLLILIFPVSMQVIAVGPDVADLLLWLPATVFFAGAFQALYLWATKAQEYRMLARNKLVLGGLTVIFQIGIGLTEPGPVGFVISNLLGQALALGLLVALFTQKARRFLCEFGPASALRQFVTYYRLALWTMPATLINTLSIYLPDFLIGRFFGSAQLGQYSLANRTVSLPTAFLATSMQDFFRQQASDEYSRFGHCRVSFRRFLALQVGISAFVILPIILVAPLLFPVIFGGQWLEAGHLVQAMAFLTIFRFVSSPLSYVWIICGYQRLDFIWQSGLLLITLSSLILPEMLFPGHAIYVTLWSYSVSVGCWYVFCVFVSYRLSEKQFSQCSPDS